MIARDEQPDAGDQDEIDVTVDSLQSWVQDLSQGDHRCREKMLQALKPWVNDGTRPTVTIPAKTLRVWMFELKRGHDRCRYQIERMLVDAGHPVERPMT